MRALPDDDVVMALAAASRHRDALLANVLATEAMNRMRRSRVITEHIHDGAFAVDAERVLTFVNPRLAGMLGGDWRDLVGRSLPEAFTLVAPDGQRVEATRSCPVQRALERGRLIEWEGACVGNGAAFDAALTVAPVTAEGAIQGAVATVRDVTERRRIDARFRLTAESITEGLLLVSRGGVVTYANPAAARILGTPRAALQGHHYADLAAWRIVRPDLAPIPFDERPIFRALHGETVANERVLLPRADGTRVHLALSAAPLALDGHEGIVATFVDTTREDVQRLRYQSMFHALPFPAFFVDLDGRVVDVNPATCALVGLPAEKAIGQHFAAFLDPADLPAAAAEFQLTLAGERTEGTYGIRRSDGARLRVRITSVPMRDAAGIAGVHGFGEILGGPTREGGP